jgi:hypothetical protein
MNNFKYLCICELKTCQLFLKNPVMLPCGSTICKEHVESFTNKYSCTLCDKDHVIPEEGFPINKFADKTIKGSFHFNELQKKIIDSYEKLEDIIKEHDSLNSENIIYEYFLNLRNQVDLHREQLIEEINKRSEEIIKQLKEMEIKSKLNAAKIEKINLDELKNENMTSFKLQLRKPNLSDDDDNNLNCDINDAINDIQNDINIYKYESLMGKVIEFYRKNDNFFGELKIEDIEKPIKAETKRAEGTLKFVIKDFSKFKESGEICLSEPCILRGLEWRIEADSEKLDDGTFELGYYLLCEDNNENQSKYFPICAKYTSKLLNLKNPDKNVVESNEYILNYFKFLKLFLIFDVLSF